MLHIVWLHHTACFIIHYHGSGGKNVVSTHILATWYQQCQPCGQFLAQENRLKLSEKHTPGSNASNGLCPMYFVLKIWLYVYEKYGYIYIYILLFDGFNHIEKYESQWEGLSHILWKKWLKPPTRLYIYIYMYVYPFSYIIYFLRGAAHGGVSFM